jgi:hypothetical protein
MLLGRRQHVHHKRAVAADGPQRQAAAVEADQHERRVQRQRADGAGRGADRIALLVDRRHDRHAGREVAHRPAELSGADLGGRLFHGCHRAISYHFDM